MSIKQLSLITILAGFLLTGCGPQITDDPISLDLGQSNSAANLDAAPTAQSTQSPPKEKVKIMKTLSDFEQIKATQAVIKTTKGDITIKLFRDKAPLTTTNFLNLAKAKFYDGIVFHRVVPNFVIQVGDPNTKDPNSNLPPGSGGPGYSIADEFDPDLTHSKAGMVSMANAGPNTGGSQFFITLAPTPHLDNVHSVFGEVISGMDVVNSIAVGDKIIQITYN